MIALDSSDSTLAVASGKERLLGKNNTSSSSSTPPDSPVATTTTTPTSLSTTATWDSVLEFGKKEAMEDDDFFNFDLDRALQYFMVFLLCISGLFDVIATLLPLYYKDETYVVPEFNLKDGIQMYTFQDFVYWLDEHDVTGSFWFSTIWFIDAFVSAGDDWRKAFLEKEKKRILSSISSRKIGSDEGEEEDFDTPPPPQPFYENPTFVYWRRIVVQVLLLPVGFFFTLHYIASHVLLDDEQVEVDLDRVANDKNESMEVEMTNEDGNIYFHSSYNVESTITLLFAILQYAWLKLSTKAVRVGRKKLFKQIRSLGGKGIRKALFHPRRFQRNVRKTLTAIRWFKYLAPLIGTANKLKGNVDDMLKKRRQEKEAERYKKARQILFNIRTPEEQKEHAAKIIQSTFRARRARRYTNALKKLQGDKEHFAALRVQRVLRLRLAEARERLRIKKAELKRLQQKSKSRRKTLTDEEIKEMYELQDEIGEQASELLNRKLLLRPNTKFAVTWKVLFVFCVILEISYLALTPWLEEQKNRRMRKEHQGPMTVQQFVAKSVIPTRISKRKECQKPKKNDKRSKQNGKDKQQKEADEHLYPWYCDGVGATIHEGYVDFLSLALIPKPVSQWSQCIVKPPKPSLMGNVLNNNGKHGEDQRRHRQPLPWYCDEPYSAFHHMYRNIADFVLKEFMLIVGIVCYLDVFITFFTGELDPNDGTLIPKPFFERWILPGLLLQMLVNPIMGSTASAAWDALTSATSIGPVRVFRWCVAVVFPLGYAFVFLTIRYVWMPFTAHQNTNMIVKQK